MPNKTGKKHKTYTAWHFFLADVLDWFIDPKDMEVYPFVKLGALPLESDFILIRKKEAGDLATLYPDFVFMIPYLGKFTLIEYKSPFDRLDYDDFDVARAYCMLAKRKYGLTRDRDIHVISMASGFQEGYGEYLADNGYRYGVIEEGIYGHMDKHHNFFWMDLRVIGERYPENFINLFSSNYKQYKTCEKATMLTKFSMLYYICQNIFKKREDVMNNMEIREMPEFTTSMEVIREKFLQSFAPDDRLAGLEPKDRLAGLEPKERLAGLKPDEILAGLGSEDIKALKAILSKTSRNNP